MKDHRASSRRDHGDHEAEAVAEGLGTQILPPQPGRAQEACRRRKATYSSVCTKDPGRVSAENECAMSKKTPARPIPSMPTWETLEALVCEQTQTTMQAVLEEELSALLGRGRGTWRSGS